MTKKIYITIDTDGLINALSLKKTPNPNEIECEVKEDHEVIKNPLAFRYKNGKIIKDIDKVNDYIKRKEAFLNQPTTKEQLAALTFHQMNSEFEVSEVKESNASMMYQIMSSEFELMSMKDSNSGLIYQLMLKGVI